MKFYLKNAGMGKDSYDILRNALKRKCAERLLELSRTKADAYVIELKKDETYQNDRYTVVPGEAGVTLTAGNDYTLFAACGRFLTDSFSDGKGGFIPAADAIDFTPKDSLRGMYFATHFHNFYHNAPIEKVYEVIEDLALRGCNSLLVWFDMHHFEGVENPGAVALIGRLRAMLKYANRIGMGGSLTMLSNEGFKNSPESMRAEWWIQNGYTRLPDGHYHVEICPNKEGGLEEILRERRTVLEQFADLKIDYVCYWPYDQGGCTCAKCTPWGSNGFMKLYPHFRDLVKEVMPDTRIILSTWYFDKFVPGEWDAFYPQIRDGMPEGTDYIMSLFFNGVLPKVIAENGLPKGVKFIDFPEISMWSCSPWGGFGASALPRFLNTTNEKSGYLYDGGFPYSEGIFEDVNKYCTLSYYSGQFENARDAVRSYVRHEFCVEGRALDELTEALLKSETGLARARYNDAEGRNQAIKCTYDVEYVYKIFSKYDRLLPDNVRLGWKFRLWYLRAVIDRELVSCDGYPKRSAIAQEALQEVASLYYAVQGETVSSLMPPFGI